MENSTIAEQWVNGLASGDLASLAPLISPAATVWHSTDGVTMDIATSAARLAESQHDASAPVFGDVRWQVTGQGFLVQSTIGSWPGATGPAHVVQVITVSGEHVVGIEEYIAVQEPPAATP